MNKLSLLLLLAAAAATAAERADSDAERLNQPVPLDDAFAGRWEPTDKCKLHPNMAGGFEILKDKSQPGVFLKKDKRATTPFNLGRSSTSKDADGILFRTTTDVDSQAGGRRLVTASLWKLVDPALRKKIGGALSTITTLHELRPDGVLVYEKYGYSADAETGTFKVEPYSVLFPENYHCEYRKAVEKPKP